MIERGEAIIVGQPVVPELARIAEDKRAAPPQALSFALETMRRMELAPAMDDIPPGIADPDDAPSIGCALAARAEVFVGGNAALEALGAVRRMPVIRPRDCWERIFPSR